MPATAAGPGGIEVFHWRFRFSEARPEASEVETVLGYSPGLAPAPVQAALEQLLASAEDLWSLEGGCVLHPSARVDVAGHRLVVDELSFEVGRIVAGQLGRSEALAVFVCTAGPGIEGLSHRLMSDGDPFTGFIADTVGSLTVERAMDRVQDHLAEVVGARGQRITSRYSPGYCGWHVQEQQKLFRLLPPGFCNVSLTASSLMRPIKSVSGVIGIGAAVRRNPYTCRLCDLEDCLYRRLQHPAADPAPCKYLLHKVLSGRLAAVRFSCARPTNAPNDPRQMRRVPLSGRVRLQ